MTLCCCDTLAFRCSAALVAANTQHRSWCENHPSLFSRPWTRPVQQHRWFCTRGMSGPGNTLMSQPGQDSHELPCSGVAGESHLVAPAALPAFLLFSPGTPRPLVRPGDRCPRGMRCSPGQADGRRAGRLSQLHLGDMSHKTDVPFVHVCCWCLAWTSTLGLASSDRLRPSQPPLFPALPFYRNTLHPEQLLPHCFLAWVPLWKWV